MKKVVVHGPGGYSELRVETHPDPPPPRPGEVEIEVAAIGVNFADCIVRMGLYASAREYVGWPITPGFEVAGRLRTPGAGLAAGTEVLAVTRFGGYATRLVVPETQVLARPAELTAVEAAAFPAVHLTAWYALCHLANVRAGDRVLVHSAAGGVGGALVQIARARGARVVGVVGRGHKVDHVRQLGADAVIDKSAEDLWKEARRAAPDGYDVILDANGHATLKAGYEHLAPGGRLVVYGFHTLFTPGRGRPSWPRIALGWLRTPRFDPLRMTNDNKSVLAFNLSYLFDRTDILHEAMAELFAWLRTGALQPPATTTYPLSQVGKAHQALENAQTTGKLVLLPP